MVFLFKRILIIMPIIYLLYNNNYKTYDYKLSCFTVNDLIYSLKSQLSNLNKPTPILCLIRDGRLIIQSLNLNQSIELYYAFFPKKFNIIDHLSELSHADQKYAALFENKKYNFNKIFSHFCKSLQEHIENIMTLRTNELDIILKNLIIIQELLDKE